ncbi:MAG TPA: hypothetical protein VD978_24440 [Azospirillum sp.]|nr:hypothetical protein [Azospirillum sp.]
MALAHAADTATSPAPAVTTTAPAKTVQMGTADTAPQTATAPVIAPATTDVPRSPDAPKPADAAKTGTHKADAHKAGKQKDVQAPTAKADAHAAAPAAKKTTVQQ